MSGALIDKSGPLCCGETGCHRIVSHFGSSLRLGLKTARVAPISRPVCLFGGTEEAGAARKFAHGTVAHEKTLAPAFQFDGRALAEVFAASGSKSSTRTDFVSAGLGKSSDVEGILRIA